MSISTLCKTDIMRFFSEGTLCKLLMLQTLIMILLFEDVTRGTGVWHCSCSTYIIWYFHCKSVYHKIHVWFFKLPASMFHGTNIHFLKLIFQSARKEIEKVNFVNIFLQFFSSYWAEYIKKNNYRINFNFFFHQKVTKYINLDIIQLEMDKNVKIITPGGLSEVGIYFIPTPKLIHHEIILPIQQSWQQEAFLIYCYKGNVPKHLFCFRGLKGHIRITFHKWINFFSTTAIRYQLIDRMEFSFDDINFFEGLFWVFSIFIIFFCTREYRREFILRFSMALLFGTALWRNISSLTHSCLPVLANQR